MKMRTRFGVVALWFGVVYGVAAFGREPLPLTDFAREMGASAAQLSPDGRRVAFLRDYEGRRAVHVVDLETMKVSYIDVGGAELVNDARKEVEHFEWVGKERLLLTTSVWDMIYGVLAVDWDGRRPARVSGYEGVAPGSVRGPTFFGREVIHQFYDEDDSALMLDRHQGGAGSANRPDVVKVRPSDGMSYVEVKNPGEVAHWAPDFSGVVRFGILTHGDLTGAIYREKEQTPWRTVLPLENRKGRLRVIGFDAGGDKLLVAKLNDERRWAAFSFDPATGETGAALLSDPEYDVVPDRGIPGAGGIDLVRAVFSRRKQALVGMRYYAEAPRTKWFDKEYATIQGAVDRALPDTVNLFVNESLDGKRMLWLGFSDQNPGAYYLFDREKKSFRLIAPRAAWLKPAQMAPMLVVKYRARDGLVIHGYLTVPVGHEMKGLPLVVLPHGGPWVRDTWGYDPLVQVLANRGYAVLQMNYRGSTGYGEDLLEKAKLQIGRQIQDDIEDGTRWAISAGIADPARIAIAGASYGGYSALFALGHNPELYRCGISLAGVTDWAAFFDQSDIADYKDAKRHWREQIGDWKKDPEEIRAISPVNFADKITAPVLLVQGKEDKRVPPDQAKRMIAALERAGHSPKSLFLAGVGHNFGNEAKRAQTYEAIVAFLEKNLGPGVP